jgi:hypothetical protein
MQTITTVGLDIAKSVFQVHGVDAAGEVVIRRQLKRRSVLAFFQKLPPCLVGIEACASSHHWSREGAIPLAGFNTGSDGRVLPHAGFKFCMEFAINSHSIETDGFLLDRRKNVLPEMLIGSARRYEDSHRGVPLERVSTRPIRESSGCSTRRLPRFNRATVTSPRHFASSIMGGRRR